MQLNSYLSEEKIPFGKCLSIILIPDKDKVCLVNIVSLHMKVYVLCIDLSFCSQYLISLVQVELIEPAVKGTLNVLKACSEENVKRVVFVSSAAAVGMTPHWPKGKVMDETSWSNKEFCRKTNVINLITHHLNFGLFVNAFCQKI